MPTRREYFISAVNLVELEGGRNIPTAVLYLPDGKQLVGSRAVALAQSRSLPLNDEFKVNLGNFDPAARSRDQLACGDGRHRSSAQLIADFFHHALNDATSWLDGEALSNSPSVLLAEPLAMRSGVAESGWLSNYRRTLERILKGKGFDRIDFLPEPFAVFQYYRYGIRHPVVAERAKHNALVLDFGGGTFDVCVVSTSREGDVSRSGRNSRPLAAASIPIGGFYINHKIAEELLRNNLDSSLHKQLNDSLKRYRRWRSGKIMYDDVSSNDQNFFRSMRALVQRVEDGKIALSRSVIGWDLIDLNSSQNQTVPLSIPENPFESSTNMKNGIYSLGRFQNLFVEEVWSKLKEVVQSAINRARVELAGESIHVVLLSGGSANIGWLRELILRDFRDQLSPAPVLHLPDFQEVVSKGLAVECARRFYSDGGDFAGTTYNRLCLVLSSDGNRSLPRFIPRTEGLPKSANNPPGVLLPAASILRNLVDIPIKWRVKMERKPSRQLDYWFLRSSFSPGDTENLQNVEERTVQISSSARSRSDRDIRLQLTVSEDGTARPRFIFRDGRSDAESEYIDGRPFYLDMTFNRPENNPKAYIGFDFGTSNSSISYVDQGKVAEFGQRSGSQRWSTLNEMVPHLPFPVAESLGRYLGQKPELLTQSGLECIESALAIASYSAYAEKRTCGRACTKLFRGFTQRSAGPLWKLLQESIGQIPKSRIIDPFREMLGSTLRDFVDSGISMLSQHKHQKTEAKGIDTNKLVKILTETLGKCLGEGAWCLGSFENVQKKAFSSNYIGLFRVHHGTPPFTRCFEYEGKESHSWNEPFLVSPTDGVALSLYPLMFWDRCSEHPDVDFGHLFLFDQADRRNDTFSFKACGMRCSCTVAGKGKYGDLWRKLRDLRESDGSSEFLEGVGQFREIEESQWGDDG